MLSLAGLAMARSATSGDTQRPNAGPRTVAAEHEKGPLPEGSGPFSSLLTYLPTSSAGAQRTSRLRLRDREAPWSHCHRDVGSLAVDSQRTSRPPAGVT